MNFAKFLRIPFSQNTSERLLLLNAKTEISISDSNNVGKVKCKKVRGSLSEIYKVNKIRDKAGKISLEF